MNPTKPKSGGKNAKPSARVQTPSAPFGGRAIPAAFDERQATAAEAAFSTDRAPDAEQPLLAIRGLRKTYEGFSLDDVNLTVEPGTVVGLVGTNGAGKTTTLAAALGLVAPDCGIVELLGCSVFGKNGGCSSALDGNRKETDGVLLPHGDNRTGSIPDNSSNGSAYGTAARGTDPASPKKLSHAKERVGTVFDSCAFPTSCRVADTAHMGKAAYASWDGACFDDLCRRFGLDAKKKIRELSRGMGMKLTLAFALAHSPELLILDEATAGLDPMARDEVLDLLRDFMELNPDRGILMATHITSDLEKIADEVICIDGGRIIFDLPKEAITDEAGIARCREGDLAVIRESGDPSVLRVMGNGYSYAVLTSDRYGFAARFPGIALDRATVEEYMALMIKGESL